MDKINEPISVCDPEIFDLIKKEKKRQINGLEMIASENFTTKAVMEANGSCLTNKYSEGYPGVRYYGGNEYIDEIERICMKRALDLFNLDPEKWASNVQPLSGSPANFQIFSALIGPHGRIMGLDLPDGGHLTHGFQTLNKKISFTSLFFETMPYHVDKEGKIDYDNLERVAKDFKPKIIVAGISCHTRPLDYGRFRKIADSVGALLMADMAHVAGLVAGNAAPGPFEHCDVVMTTTHKSLRGPRSAIIFSRKGVQKVLKNGKEVIYNLEGPIREAVFPGLQGGPHNHQIAAVAVALKQAAQPEFKEYAQQILRNCQFLFGELKKFGYTFITDGSENHLLLMDVRPQGLDGARAEKILDKVHISVNKNTVPGDLSALKPSGIRLGTPALTTRGFKEGDFAVVAQLLHEALSLGVKINQSCPPGHLLKEYQAVLDNPDSQFASEIAALTQKIHDFAGKFPMPGHDDM